MLRIIRCRRDKNIVAALMSTASFSSNTKTPTPPPSSSLPSPYPIIAINFGSTNAYLSVLEDAENHQSTNPAGAKAKPKAKVLQKLPVAFVPLGKEDKTIPEDAHSPRNLIRGFNRLVGRTYEEPFIQQERKRVPFNIVRAPNGQPWVLSTYRYLGDPNGVVVEIMSRLKKTAESYLGTSISKAVITFPSKSTDDQVEAMLDLALHTGLDVQEGITDAVAAAISHCVYGKEFLNNTKEEGHRVFAVVDMGGRTLSVSILEEAGKHLHFKLKGPTESDLFFGGDDFDNVIAHYLVDEIKKVEGDEISTDIPIFYYLRNIAEEIKIELSSASVTTATLPYISADNIGKDRNVPQSDGKTHKVMISTTQFEGLVSHLVERIKSTIESCLKAANIAAKDVDEVLLVGGMARVPAVQKVVADVFGKSPSRGVDPQEAVALGAAAALVEIEHYHEMFGK